MALARHWLWTIPHSASLSALLSLSLKATTSYSLRAHIPLSIQYTVHQRLVPVTWKSSPAFIPSTCLCLKFYQLSCWLTHRDTLCINMKGSKKLPTFFRVLRTSCDPPTNPIIKTWAAHHRCALAQPSFHLWIKPCWIFPAWRRLDLTQRASEQSNYWFDQKHICLRRNYDWFWFTVPHVRFLQHMEPNSENKENECGQWGSFVPLQ